MLTFSFIWALKVYNFLSFCCLSFYFYRAPIVPKIWQLVFVHQNLIESFQGKNLAFVFYKTLIFELSFGIKFLTMQHVLVYQHHLDLVTYLGFLCISKMNKNTFTVFNGITIFLFLQESVSHLDFEIELNDDNKSNNLLVCKIYRLNSNCKSHLLRHEEFFKIWKKLGTLSSYVG